MHLLFDIGGSKMRLGVSADGETIKESRIIPRPEDFREGILTFENFKNSNDSQEAIKGFEMSDQDGKFQPAVAQIVGENIEVSSTAVKNPTAIRYNWSENPTGNFYQNGLPALPFRTNNPLTQQFKIN